MPTITYRVRALETAVHDTDAVTGHSLRRRDILDRAVRSAYRTYCQRYPRAVVIVLDEKGKEVARYDPDKHIPRRSFR